MNSSILPEFSYIDGPLQGYIHQSTVMENYLNLKMAVNVLEDGDELT